MLRWFSTLAWNMVVVSVSPCVGYEILFFIQTSDGNDGKVLQGQSSQNGSENDMNHMLCFSVSRSQPNTYGAMYPPVSSKHQISWVRVRVAYSPYSRVTFSFNLCLQSIFHHQMLFTCENEKQKGLEPP